MTAREQKALVDLVITGLNLDDARIVAEYAVRRAGHLWWFVAPDALDRLNAMTDDPDRQKNLQDIAAVMRHRKHRRVTELRRKHERQWARHNKRRRPTRPAPTDTDQQEVPT